MGDSDSIARSSCDRVTRASLNHVVAGGRFELYSKYVLYIQAVRASIEAAG
jgi:hypothetical protein